MSNVDILAQILWDYHHMNHELREADIIFVLCSHDLRVADYAVKLFQNNMAKYVVFSGGIAHKGDLIETPWDEPEADVFAKRAIELGIVENQIIVENKATNCGENVMFTEKILTDKNVQFEKIIGVQKPYMERRTYATIKKHWPNKKIMVTSPPIVFDEYYTDKILKEDVINIMVGDLQRIREYPKKGFQIEQAIPDDVWDAFETLCEYGFKKHLIYDV